MLSSVKKKLQQNINKILQLFMHTYKNKWQHFDHVFYGTKKDYCGWPNKTHKKTKISEKSKAYDFSSDLTLS